MRPSLNTTMLTIAKTLAERATCKKLSVGCVLVDAQGRILSTGYNGVPKGWAHCNDGHPCEVLCEATHAESNALLSCHQDRQLIYACYVTHSPCLPCLKQLIQTGCQEVFFLETVGGYEESQAFWEKGFRRWHNVVL